MGTWGYYSYPTEPNPGPDWEQEMDRVVDQESLEEFIAQEMSYADSLDDGWGAWMGGEL